MHVPAVRACTEKILYMSVNTSSRAGQCATVFSILSLFNYTLYEAVCPPVSTVYSPTLPSESIYTLIINTTFYAK